MPTIHPFPLESPTPPLYSLACHPTRNLIASASLDYSIKLYDGETKALVSKLEGHDGAVLVVRFSVCGLLASGSDDKKVVVWGR